MDISVILPTLNRAGSLEKTLSSLVTQDKDPKEFEILIIDNGSTDNTKNISEIAISSNPGHAIRYFYEPVPGLLAGRHRGVKESQCDLLVFIDDDIIADKGWLNAIVESFKRFPDIHLVGGKCLPNYEKAPPEWLQYFWREEPGGEIGRAHV
jgi:glucosyl-dolichyl phosphate glucuronosyltransferase